MHFPVDLRRPALGLSINWLVVGLIIDSFVPKKMSRAIKRTIYPQVVQYSYHAGRKKRSVKTDTTDEIDHQHSKNGEKQEKTEQKQRQTPTNHTKKPGKITLFTRHRGKSKAFLKIIKGKKKDCYLESTREGFRRARGGPPEW
ncbi:MAG: hypothetical protein HQL52_10695 [Magnetococcales bacterium]|nr:hypothetical protein [Magnetococcales bacterium]